MNNDNYAIVHVANRILEDWSGQNHKENAFEPYQAIRFAAQPAQRFDAFADLFEHVQATTPLQGWVMQPSTVHCLTGPGQTLPNDAPWLAAEFLLPGRAGLSVHYDGRAFVCARVEELSDDADQGEPALVTTCTRLVSDSPRLPQSLSAMNYRVIHLHDVLQGWHVAAARFDGFEQKGAQQS